MINMRHTGYFAIATDVGAEVSERAIEEIGREIKLLQNTLTDEAELETVKRIMFGEFMRILDGPMGVLDALIEATQNNTTLDYLADSLDQIRNITPERVQQLACQYLDTDTLTTVIVGKK